MALISPTPLAIPGTDLVDLHIYQWGPMKFGDTCVPVARGDIVDRSIQASGTFGAGTVCNIQGSNDATSTTTGSYFNLHDPFSNIISMTAAGLAQVTEVTAWMKPAISSGDGNESITFTIVSRRSLK